MKPEFDGRNVVLSQRDIDLIRAAVSVDWKPNFVGMSKVLGLPTSTVRSRWARLLREVNFSLVLRGKSVVFNNYEGKLCEPKGEPEGGVPNGE